MKIICSKFAEHISKKLASKPYNVDVLFTGKNDDDSRVFPDGESYVSLPDADKLKGERVVILTCGRPNPTECLFELDVLATLAKEHGASSIEIFFLYFPFGMQDSSFKKGELNIARFLCEKFKEHKMYAIDLHSAKHDWTKKYITNLSAMKLILNAIKKDGINLGELQIIAPDLGSQKRLNIEGMSKTREDYYTATYTSTEKLNQQVNGKPVLVFDDMIETGGTMACAKPKCDEMGATQVLAAITHGVLSVGVERIKKTYNRLFLTNTIPNQHANVDITPLVYEAIK
jgi:ribose-phosphate pyrophosphokinase